MSKLIDVAIIGGGPAGLTAGLYAARGAASTMIFERGMPGGQIVTTDHVENYPAFPEGVTGAELGQLMHDQAIAQSAELASFVDITALEIEDDGTFALASEYETYRALSVIFATGAIPAKLGIAGEDTYTGRGVSWCATCDGAFYRGKTVAVIGGGDAAVEEALFLTKFATKVILIHRRDEFRAASVLVERAKAHPQVEMMLSYVPLEVLGDGSKVTGLSLQSVKDASVTEIDCDGVFEFVGTLPQNSLVEGLGLTDIRGYVNLGADGSTAIPGLFCAGDVSTSPLKQVVTAAGAGALAATSALHYLDQLAHGNS